ncbi:MAG: glycosyltransferase [Candidatus Bathyarchaeota archaeon]|nr:glycosyltransferase [Candidatus Bathyarchaeota archaeon]
MSIAEIIFYSTFFLLLAGFSAFFALMVYYSRKRCPVNKKDFLPTVSVIITTYNEVKVISRKLKNTFEIDYPPEKLQIMVVDSASNDGTVEAVQTFVETTHNKVDILTQSKRMGKASALNYAFPFCKGDIVILTDADVSVDPDAVKRIVTNFGDETVGAVSGIQVMRNPDQSAVTQEEQGYRSFYNILRMGETNMDSVVMCESEFAAYRKELLEVIPPNSICDDMQLTLRVRKKGLRAIYDDSVSFYENSSIGRKSRLKQKIRRSQGNQQALFNFAGMMFKKQYSYFSSVILPFEFFINVVAPLLTVICSVSFIVAILFSFNSLIILVPLLSAILATLVLFALFKKDSLTTTVTLGQSQQGGSLRMAGVILDFILMQFVMFAGLLILLFHGPDYKWEKIEDVRQG